MVCVQDAVHQAGGIVALAAVLCGGAERPAALQAAAALANIAARHPTNQVKLGPRTARRVRRLRARGSAGILRVLPVLVEPESRTRLL
jgi:hypothetical protein